MEATSSKRWTPDDVEALTTAWLTQPAQPDEIKKRVPLLRRFPSNTIRLKLYHLMNQGIIQPAVGIGEKRKRSAELQLANSIPSKRPYVPPEPIPPSVVHTGDTEELGPRQSRYRYPRTGAKPTNTDSSYSSTYATSATSASSSTPTSTRTYTEGRDHSRTDSTTALHGTTSTSKFPDTSQVPPSALPRYYQRTSRFSLDNTHLNSLTSYLYGDEPLWTATAIEINPGFSDSLVQVTETDEDQLLICVGPTVQNVVASLSPDPTTRGSLRLKVAVPIPDHSALPTEVNDLLSEISRPFELRYKILLPAGASAMIPSCHFADAHKMWVVPLI